MSEHLLIGGVADGRIVDLKSTSRYVIVPVLGDGGYGQQRYRREELRSGERVYHVYFCDDIPHSDVLGRLIAGYNLGMSEERADI